MRLRRDFCQLLNLIRAHAIVHQATRERDAEGRILASLHDDVVVREPLADVISEGVEATVSPAVCEAVAAATRLLGPGNHEASITELAHALGLDKSAAARRIATAIQLGYLRNLEDRKGHPARLIVGEPLPESVSILPSVQVLHGCSVDRGYNPPERRSSAAP